PRRRTSNEELRVPSAAGTLERGRAMYVGRVVASVFVVLFGCSRQKPPVEAPRPISIDEASAFASEYRKAAVPCDTDRLGALIDRDAFRERLLKNNPKHATLAVALIEGLSGTSLVATKLCAWMNRVEDYKFLRVRQ